MQNGFAVHTAKGISFVWRIHAWYFAEFVTYTAGYCAVFVDIYGAHRVWGVQEIFINILMLKKIPKNKIWKIL